jgi:predicted HAD superfamily Cof-like phosphohydrolase
VSDAAFLLPLHLQTFVPLRIAELRRAGGPSEADFERVRDKRTQDICEHADELLYRGKQEGTAARLITVVVDSVAVLAFCPGGIDIFGLHFEVRQ